MDKFSLKYFKFVKSDFAMRTTQIRQQLHDYIDSAEEKKLKAIYTLLENDITDEFTLTAAQKKELDRRYNDYMNGVGETDTWEETVAMARQALADRKNKK
jgi:putative addiction module component (TIGR02574 family)